VCGTLASGSFSEESRLGEAVGEGMIEVSDGVCVIDAGSMQKALLNCPSIQE